MSILALATALPRIPPTPIPAHCPWHGLSQYGLPNVNWCEESLCAWINEPANAWSNLAYLLAALWIYLRPGRTLPAGPLRWFAPVLATVGICSGIYHASNVHVTQMLDFLGMYLFCFLLLGINGVRMGVLRASQFATWLTVSSALATVGTTLAVRVGIPIQGFIGLLTLALVVTEALLRRQNTAAAEGPTYRLQPFFGSLALLTAAACCSALDVSRTWCDPQNHILQGHAAWHVLSACSLLVAFYHYRQFAARLTA